MAFLYLYWKIQDSWNIMHSHLHSTKMIIPLRWFFTRIILLRYRDLNQQPSDSSLFGFVLPSLLEFRKWTVNGLYVIPCSNVISFMPYDSSFENSCLGWKRLFLDYPGRNEIQLYFFLSNCACYFSFLIKTFLLPTGVGWTFWWWYSWGGHLGFNATIRGGSLTNPVQ